MNWKAATSGDIRLKELMEKGIYFYLRYDEGKDVDVFIFIEKLGQFRSWNFFNPSTYAHINQNISLFGNHPTMETKIAIAFRTPRRSLHSTSSYLLI